ncbi:M1 family metallopeptidase [Hymenobacter sp. H14-R3]|uniref:M1 family metallopeptidase n=1 Tax=Hymenobacter sp. H14-R3 TaxID=3046308 RepID=UPI0024B94483|nr:M1 family metallopeptidase [Hymenobacter sp. H14-R3]MDJ0364518.1 M1 family metallopeptidase [Hymenobacter sp. H14-R3]
MKNTSTFSRCLLLILLALTYSASQAQTALPMPRNLRATYDKGTRSPTGQPGPKYWQNTADYTIKVNFDPATRRLAGTVHIKYQNNSPDSLRQLWFKLYPNLYQKGAPRSGKFSAEDLSDGVKIERLSINGQVIDPSSLLIDNTNMVVPLRRAIGAHQAAQVEVAYSYVLNKGSHQRTGEVAPGAAFVAYFFPRIAVYDDIDGWNRIAYTGGPEFYNDFCHFEVDITVPRNFLVWATGELTNADKVLTKKYLARLRTAEKKDGITSIIDSAEARLHDATAPNAYNTWHFDARDVTDFAFATADHYVWESTSLVVDRATKRRTRVDAVYNAKHDDFEEVAQFGRKTVEAMSYTFPKWPYPYSHETVFDGLDQMEYPMMVNDNPTHTREESITLTDHEIFHTMFPFYMGINETKYAWMDEGWATIGEWIISPLIQPGLVDDYGMVPYARAADTEDDLPIVTLTTQQTGTPFFLNSYPKPGLGYLYVKDMLGDELFTKALHTYIGTWHGKHPMPYDFFYSMNAGAGQNLDWFWQRWFFEGGYPDLAITSVARPADGPAAIVVTAKGSKPMPVDLTVTFDNGSEEKIHRTIAVWKDGAKRITVPVAGRRAIRQVTLGSTYTPDSYPADNAWTAPQ